MLWATHVHTWAYTLIIKFVNGPFQNLNKNVNINKREQSHNI